MQTADNNKQEEGLLGMLAKANGPDPAKAAAREAKRRASANEVCRNYLAGRCKYGTQCFRQHPPGKEGSSKGERKKIKCYACGEDGYHLAKNCKNPRQQANAINEEKANKQPEGNETTLAEFLRNTSSG